MATQTERVVFLCLAAGWASSPLFFGPSGQIVVALIGVVIYFKSFAVFAQKILANEWPYSLIGVLGVLVAFLLSPLASVNSNHIIAAITGFHASIFPNSVSVLSMLFYFFLFAVVLALVAGLSAGVTGFSANPLNRVFAITFALAIPIVYLVASFVGPGGQDTILKFENLIIYLDFDHNDRFEVGVYVTPEHKSRQYGTKVCPDLSYDSLIAPHPEGGYIIASPRGTPAKLEQRVGDHVLATRYVYSFLEQEKCPAVNEYSEQQKD